MEQGHAAGTKVRRQAVSRWMRPWLVTGDHLRRIGLVVISVAVAIVIACAPFGMEWIARFRRDWVTLGNIAQAYGGFSALISAIALVGVVGSLLIQVRQHSLDRSASILSFIGRFLAGFPVTSGLFASTQCEWSFFTIAWPGMSAG